MRVGISRAVKTASHIQRLRRRRYWVATTAAAGSSRGNRGRQ